MTPLNHLLRFLLHDSIINSKHVNFCSTTLFTNTIVYTLRIYIYIYNEICTTYNAYNFWDNIITLHVKKSFGINVYKYKQIYV